MTIFNFNGGFMPNPSSQRSVSSLVWGFNLTLLGLGGALVSLHTNGVDWLFSLPWLSFMTEIMGVFQLQMVSAEAIWALWMVLSALWSLALLVRLQHSRKRRLVSKAITLPPNGMFGAEEGPSDPAHAQDASAKPLPQADAAKASYSPQPGWKPAHQREPKESAVPSGAAHALMVDPIGFSEPLKEALRRLGAAGLDLNLNPAQAKAPEPQVDHVNIEASVPQHDHLVAHSAADLAAESETPVPEQAEAPIESLAELEAAVRAEQSAQQEAHLAAKASIDALSEGDLQTMRLLYPELGKKLDDLEKHLSKLDQPWVDQAA
jgi:hypothetical protein